MPYMAIDIKSAIVVLGSPNAKDGRLFDVAIQRCELALSEYKNHPDYKFLLTGGYGAHFNETNLPHAYYLAQYLIKSGVPENDILEYAESANSKEDATLSKPTIKKHNIKNIVIITSDYHLDRTQYIFKHIFMDLNINISFKVVQSDLENSEINIAELIEHEKIALEELKEFGLENYYNR